MLPSAVSLSEDSGGIPFPPLLLGPRAPEATDQGFGQVIEGGAFAQHDHDLDRHPRADAVGGAAQFGQFLGGNDDLDAVDALFGAFRRDGVGGDAGDLAIQDGGVAFTQAGEFDLGALADDQVVDVGGVDRGDDDLGCVIRVTS